MVKRRKILYAVLNWGIGHATRSLPLLRGLGKDHDITVMSTGRSLELLRSELPDIRFIDHPDYSVKYTKKGGSLLLSLFFQIPKILLKLKEEHRFTEKLVEEQKFDRIISDNRYGIYSKKIPSYFLTHQIRFKLSEKLRYLEIFSEYFNKLYFRNYRKVFIPDEKEDINLSGDLSHRRSFVENPKISYIGLLADLNCKKPDIYSDILFIISGPEPQRSIFEDKILSQSPLLQGKKIIVRGVTEKYEKRVTGDSEIYSCVNRDKLSAMIRGAKLIVSRPGYSTVMEVASYGKRALFVPTPGQTEQEYLARYYVEKGYFSFVGQESMELVKDISKIKEQFLPEFFPNNISGVINEIVS
ncbi:MAG: glycosyltransferase family protein [Candidatus Delongbacteria bacterium]